MVAMNTALTEMARVSSPKPMAFEMARRSAPVILGVSEESSTAVSMGPMTAKNVVKAVRNVSIMER